MTSQRPITARAVAMAVLNEFNPQRNYASPILNKLLDKTQERQRATDLVFGTIRNQTAIDMIVAGLGDCPAERIPAKLLNIIRIGAYELIYSPTTPDYSIVNEAVENAGTIAGKKQTGFVNALLRQISRHIENRQIPLSDSDVRKTLPQTPLTGCEFDSDILPDPKVAPADYLSAAFSLPRWLVNDWLGEFGPEKTRQFCFASNRRPSIYVRPNKLKTTTEQIAEKFRQAKIDFETLPDKSMVRMKAARAVTELPGFAQGLFTIQDMTASQAVRILDPQPDWTILDLCAAPGTKTTQLAELTGDSAKIIATDINNERLEKVKENIARLGINSVNIVPYKELLNSKFEILNSKFDCVLLDVPCSNTGVLAKRIELRYRIRPRTITGLAKTQKELIEAVAAMIKPQGEICYSTCSIQKEEDGQLIGEFLRKNRNFKLESEKLTLPSAEDFDHDGGYIAILVRK